MPKLTWKAFKQNWIELSAVILVLIIAAVMAILKPFDAVTIGYFGDMATVLLIGVAIMLMVIGARRRVV